MARLIIISKDKKETRNIDKSPYTIGSSSQSDFQLPYIPFSLCKIIKVGTDYWLYNNNPTGLVVNGVVMFDKTILKDRDIIEFIPPNRGKFDKLTIIFEKASPKNAITPGTEKSKDQQETADSGKKPVFVERRRRFRMYSTKPILYLIAVWLIVIVIFTFIYLYLKKQLKEVEDVEYARLVNLKNSDINYDELIKQINIYIARYPDSPHVQEIKRLQEECFKIKQDMLIDTEKFEGFENKLSVKSEISDLEDILNDGYKTLLTIKTPAIKTKFRSRLRELENIIERYYQREIDSISQECSRLIAQNKFQEARNLILEKMKTSKGSKKLRKKLKQELNELNSQVSKKYEHILSLGKPFEARQEYKEAIEIYERYLNLFSGFEHQEILKKYISKLKKIAKESSKAKDKKQGLPKIDAETKKFETYEIEIKNLVAKYKFEEAHNKLTDLENVIRNSSEYSTYSLTLAKRIEKWNYFVQNIKAVFKRLIDTINNSKLALNGNLLDLSGEQDIKIIKADSNEFTFTSNDGKQASKQWNEIKPINFSKILSKSANYLDEKIAISIFLYFTGNIMESYKSLYEIYTKASTEKYKIDEVLGFLRNVPQEEAEFYYLNGLWLTNIEYLCQNIPQIKDIKAYEEINTYLNTLSKKLSTESYKRLVECAKKEFSNLHQKIVKELEKSVDFNRYKLLEALKVELNKRREEALKLIRDEKFYVYDPQKNDHGEKAQPTIDKAVKLVEEIWNNPLQYIPKVNASINELVYILEDVRRKLNEWSEADSIKTQQWFEYLKEPEKIFNIRTFALNEAEKKLLEYNRQVALENDRINTSMDEDERKMVSLVNNYREVMGLKLLRINEKLVQSARKHSQTMKDTNTFSHEEPFEKTKTPGDRARIEGYEGFVAENIAKQESIGSRGEIVPKLVFKSWCGSSAHHRAILSDFAEDIGCGRVSEYWTLLVGSEAKKKQ